MSGAGAGQPKGGGSGLQPDSRCGHDPGSPGPVCPGAHPSAQHRQLAGEGNGPDCRHGGGGPQAGGGGDRGGRCLDPDSPA